MQSQIWMVLVTVKVVLLGSCLPFELTILHTNDVRSRFESFNSNSHSCSYEDIGKNQCYGGAARMSTAIKRIRQSEANVLLLDAGDQFQGSAWYTLLKWHPLAKLMNALQYDAMTLGNREFNDWLPGLIPFMSNVQFPVLSSNIESDSQEFMQLLKKYIIIDVGVEKVGIVGYTTTQKGLFVVREPTVNFNEELPAVRQAVNQLRQLGVNKIIALGHSGLAVDKAICEQVEGVDIVVGAHDDTFLYTGKPPIDKNPGAPYPVVIDQQAGGKCIIVQDERYGKFLGYLKASFDSDGKLVKWSGNPILIDSAVAPDAEVAALLQPYQNDIGNLKTEIVATAATSIDGTRTTCRHAVKGRKGNCTAGSLIADAHRSAFLTKPANYRGEWTRVNAAIMNSRGIRGNLFFPQGATISMDDLYSMTPFQYKIQRYILKGEHLLDLLKTTVTKTKQALHFSGIRAVFDFNRQPSDSLTEASILCTDCSPTRFEPILPNKFYAIAILSYIVELKQYASLNNAQLDPSYEVLDIDSVRAYFEQFSPLEVIDDGRVSVTREPDRVSPTGTMTDKVCPVNSGKADVKPLMFLIPIVFVIGTIVRR